MEGIGVNWEAVQSVLVWIFAVIGYLYCGMVASAFFYRALELWIPATETSLYMFVPVCFFMGLFWPLGLLLALIIWIGHKLGPYVVRYVTGGQDAKPQSKSLGTRRR